MLCHLHKLEILNIRFLGFTEVLRTLTNAKKQTGSPASQETLCLLWMPRLSPRPQQPATGVCLKPDESSPHPYFTSKEMYQLDATIYYDFILIKSLYMFRIFTCPSSGVLILYSSSTYILSCPMPA